ncbi:MAG TPA: histidine kinase N-terminal 7TM domain-containing protein [Anaerolineales bacterium]|nr:histidine kinase N-terminal 7TM domain-containing protein [Anaerolineales bacterium]HRQ91981.1 histidine kinase N-terminal 7TM domain-containing protein [Anaerolineales bacterium]
MDDLVLRSLETINRIFEAGIAITALSLFLRSLTFNLRDRISRAFAVILACVMISFLGEAVAGVLNQSASLEVWLRLQWVGTLFLPAAYLHFSDALLETTGRPSRGRRRWAVRFSYFISAAFALLLPSTLFLGPLAPGGQPVPHLSLTPLSWGFTLYYVVTMLMAFSVMYRARQRTVLSASRRRMTYLLAGSLAVAVGSYPFLLLMTDAAASVPILFFLGASIANVFVFYAMVAMAYATAFFGVPWPDRVVKSRLFRWLLRGPVTVFIVLALIPWADDIGRILQIQEGVVMPILVGLSILLVSHILTLAAPVLEKWLIFGGSEEDVQFLQELPERFLTDADMRQFLEAVLASVLDRFQSKSAFVVSLQQGEMQAVVEVGSRNLRDKDKSKDLLQVASRQDGEHVFSWGAYRLLPLLSNDGKRMIGMLGVQRGRKGELSDEQLRALETLGQRAAQALEDRQQQVELLRSMQSLTPRVEVIQRLRAASRYDQAEVLSEVEQLPKYQDLVRWVRDALTHYWGGPKLTQNPLRGLQVVQSALDEHEGNPSLAMRAILKTAIERNRPDGEPRLNGEWMLYNLLEMKFMQGRKVREVAMRLAMSEADLYRKQRVAIESVARSLLEMEKDTLAVKNGKETD